MLQTLSRRKRFPFHCLVFLTLLQSYAGSTLLRSLIDDILPRAPVKSSQVQQKLREVRIACTGKSRSTIARNISLIPDDRIIFAFGLLKEFGLFVWKPDILGGSPTSTYNFVHETAFLKIFGQLILTRGLEFVLFLFPLPETDLCSSHMGVLPKYANNSALQRRFYQNYLFVTCKNQAKREAKGKGKVKEDSEHNAVVHRRLRVSPLSYV